MHKSEFRHGPWKMQHYTDRQTEGYDHLGLAMMNLASSGQRQVTLIPKKS